MCEEIPLEKERVNRSSQLRSGFTRTGEATFRILHEYGNAMAADRTDHSLGVR